MILDIGLPDIDCYEVLAELKRMPHLAVTNFIALTGYDTYAFREASEAAGFHHHLVKHTSANELLAVLGHKLAGDASM